eukprot:TRINITY_DN4223_c0_g1_i2.p2 TRINITY_DN4223_c0_g1~~TRINITY_DN4223_c0_g1_i2.p2  ORF type:complete len:166 (-),score=30.93 TRINITY_DN4223_c0_g1_i2:21-518(-)
MLLDCWFFVCFFFFNDTATTEIYTRSIVGSVRCVQETDIEQKLGKGNLSETKIKYQVLCCGEKFLQQKVEQEQKRLDYQHVREYGDATDKQPSPREYHAVISCVSVSYTHLRAHETSLHLVCRLLLEKKKKNKLRKADQKIDSMITINYMNYCIRPHHELMKGTE